MLSHCFMRSTTIRLNSFGYLPTRLFATLQLLSAKVCQYECLNLGVQSKKAGALRCERLDSWREFAMARLITQEAGWDELLTFKMNSSKQFTRTHRKCGKSFTKSLP